MPVKPSDARLLQEYIEKGWEFHIIELLYDMKPVEIAELIETLDDESRGSFFALLDVDTASEVIAELSSETREDVVEGMSDKDLARIVEDMNTDDAADLLGDLHAERVERVLAAMNPEDSSDIKSLLKYPEDTAGGIMQRELISARADETVDEVISRIRQLHSEVDDIQTVYVVDSARVLIGTVPLVKLILSKPQVDMSRIMNAEPLAVPVKMDQEKVAQLFKKYDEVAMPVVDDKGVLLGRITIDDIVDIIEEEATEDMFRLAGAEEDLLSSSIIKNASTRIPWLFICWIGGILITLLIRRFEPTLSQLVGLAAFMPIILGMGGNVASQSVTLVVRGIATGVVSTTNFLTTAVKQLAVGLFLGGTYGLMLGGIAFFIYPERVKMSLVVGLAIMNSMTLAAFMGTVLPMLFYKMGKDPAIASGPFVSTAMDLIGVVTYFTIATLLLF